MHNYIVKNDEKANYVEFNVSIPDGYNSFKVDYINGSIINQNYLNVGDRIIFKFNNNPLRYDVPEGNINLNLLTAARDKTPSDSYMGLSYKVDSANADYKFINLALNNFYKLVFIPIYTVFSTTHYNYIYIFNPCDDNADNFLEAPIKNIPAKQLSDTIFAEFAGNYVLALVPTDGNKISDIMLTVGESINNSKMRPQDAGSFQISSSTINEVNTTTLQKEAYNYGSTWNYPVHNLIMNHKQSIKYVQSDTLQNPTRFIVFQLTGTEENRTYTTTYSVNNTLNNVQIDDSGKYTVTNANKTLTYIYYTYDKDDNNSPALVSNSMLTTTQKYIPLQLFRKVGNNYYLCTDRDNIIANVNVSFLAGTELCDGNYYTLNDIYTNHGDSYTDVRQINASTNYFKFLHNDLSYKYKVIKVRLRIGFREKGTEKYRSLTDNGDGHDFSDYAIFTLFNNQANKACKFECKSYKQENIGSIKCFSDINYHGEFVPADKCEYFIECKIGSENTYHETTFEEFPMYVIGPLHATKRYSQGKVVTSNDNKYKSYSVYDLYTHCYTGITTSEPAYTNINTITQNTKEILQQTVNDYHPSNNPADITNNNKRCSNPEDIMIQAVKDKVDKNKHGVELSFNELSNKVCNYNIQDDYTVLLTYDDAQWQHGNNTESFKCFVPHKSTAVFESYPYVPGFIIINDLNGDNTINLTDANSEIYLSTGHETLNIDPANIDDDKFKTFNGSLLFDRSNSRITRLFSNDVTGSCLGYLNDLLSAKLSRYYTCVNYNIWNTFINTNNTISLTLNSTSLKDIYASAYADIVTPNNDNKYPISGHIFTGAHEYVLASCFDICKLIGSEAIVNNCIPNLSIEQQQYNNVVVLPYDKRTETLTGNVYPSTMFYKFFHYYNSALDTYPYNGLSTNDMYDGSTTVGGVNLICVDTPIITSDKSGDEDYSKALQHYNFNTYRGFYVTNISKYDALDKESEIPAQCFDDIFKGYYNTNKYLSKCAVMQTLPAFRIYRNSNFEQTDLTITTGGVKTIHPIYLQSTPRILLNNVLYLFDFVINQLMNNRNIIYEKTSNTGGFYVNTMTLTDNINSISDTIDNTAVKYPLIRFPINIVSTEDNTYSYSTDFLSLLLLNYCNGNIRSINDYYDANSLAEVLPALDSKDNTKNNEEIIQDMIINDESTCVQLFSNKFFKFYDNVDIFNVVTFKQQYVDSVYYNNILLGYYYNIEELNNSELTAITNSIDSLINNVESYNNLKLCKIFICKLGEFLDYPKILFGAVDTFMNSLRVSVNSAQTIDSALPVKQFARDLNNPDNGKYDENAYTVFDSKLNNYNKDDNKRNTYMFGVIFKYHQLALGYQNLSNELSDDYNISKANGQRHFKLIIYDEYGRKIPNTDTSQGFKNNLMLELTLA